MPRRSGFIPKLRNILTPEMDHAVIESIPFLWSTRIVDIISTLILAFILFAHLCSRSSNKTASHMSMRVLGDIQKWTTALDIFTILFVLTQFLLLLSLSLNIWEVVPTSFSCNTIVLFMVSLYHLSKSSFYCVLITRLQVAFYASSLKYSTVTIVSLYVFVIFYTIFVCVGSPFLITGVWIIDDPETWCHIHTHDTRVTSMNIGIFIMMDVLISVVLCWLFMRPIKQILQYTPDEPNVRFSALYIKYGLLTYISIILNLLSMMFYLFDHLTILIEITASINAICIVLMYARYERVFQCCCGWVVGCCLDKRIKKQREDKGNMNIDTENDALKSDIGHPEEVNDEEYL